MRKVFLLFIVLIYSVINGNVIAQTQFPKELDSYFAAAYKAWEVPGIGVGIIKDGKTVLAKGYGLRNIEKKDSVDAHTIFPVASNTKAFTATAIAMLVDEGKLSWDTKVVEILPFFSLYDPYVTQHFTIADLLSHHSGLETFSGDLLWYASTYKTEEVVRKLPLLQPKYEFRTTFGYSNIMYMAAGLIVEKVSGMPYNDFIKTRILQPLLMNETYNSIEALAKMKNVCSPHNKVNEKVFPIELLNWDNIGGAGNLNSNVNDMLQWLQLQLNAGIWKGDTLFTQKQIAKMLTTHTVLPVSQRAQELWPSMHYRGYGLGWSTMDYHGRKVVSHSGGYDGVISYTCFVPEENLAFVILTNSNSSLYNALNYKILDYYLSKDTTDWSAFFLPYQQGGDQREVLVAPAGAKAPTLNLKAYEGLYRCDVYGNALVKVKGQKITIQLLQSPKFIGEVKVFDADTFMIEFKQFPALPQGKVFFNTKDSKVLSFQIDVPNPDFDFMEFNFVKLESVKLPED